MYPKMPDADCKISVGSFLKLEAIASTYVSFTELYTSCIFLVAMQITTKLKDALKTAKECMEKRLQEEQKMVGAPNIHFVSKDQMRPQPFPSDWLAVWRSSL